MSRPDCQIHNPEDCPPFCRHLKRVPRRSILDILQEWQQNFLDLKWMVGTGGPPEITSNHILEDTYEEIDAAKMREIYRQHDWPHNFRATQCREALAQMPYAEDNDSTTESDTDNED
jgi:hypothetical protein